MFLEHNLKIGVRTNRDPKSSVVEAIPESQSTALNRRLSALVPADQRGLLRQSLEYSSRQRLG